MNSSFILIVYHVMYISYAYWVDFPYMLRAYYMRTTCMFMSSSASRMGVMRHMYPGGPNNTMRIRNDLALTNQFRIISQCGPARFPGVLIYQSDGVEIHKRL